MPKISLRRVASPSKLVGGAALTARLTKGPGPAAVAVLVQLLQVEPALPSLRPHVAPRVEQPLLEQLPRQLPSRPFKAAVRQRLKVSKNGPVASVLARLRPPKPPPQAVTVVPTDVPPIRGPPSLLKLPTGASVAPAARYVLPCRPSQLAATQIDVRAT